MSSIEECVHETDIANNFTIPSKIVKSERLQDINDVSNNLDYKLISETIKHSLWDKQTSELGHSLTRIQLINNPDLKEQYENHKKERKQKSKKEKICERTVYYVCFDEQQAIDISNNGFKCTESDNFLGDSSQGIHFSKHLDILLKYEYSKDNRANQLFCIMTKAFYDVEKLKTIKAKYDNKGICASKLHDGHVACLNLLCLTNANSNLASKLISKNYYMETLIYLYGLDESFQCIKKPKNILPYAILKYELKNPHVFNRKLIKPRQNVSNTIKDRYFNNLIEKSELFQESDACRLVKNFGQEESASVDNFSDNDDNEPKDDLKLFDDYYLNEQEEKMPKWRIIYEKTGNLDTMFHGSRRMECRLNNVKHLGLKYFDDDKSIINVNNPTNKFILQYYSKRIKKNITSITTTTASDEADLNVKYVKKDDSNTNVKSILRIGLQSYLNVNFSYIPVNRTNKIKSSSLATEVNEIKNVKFEKPITKPVSATVQTKSLVKPTVKQISTIIKSSKESSDPTKKQLVKSAEELKKKQPQQQNSEATKQPLNKTEELNKKQPKEEVTDKNKPLLISKKLPTTTSISSENISKSKTTTTSNSNNTTTLTTKSVTNLITSRPQAKEVIKNVFEKNRSKSAIVSTTNPSSSSVVSSKSLTSSVEIKKLDLTEKLIESIKNSSKRKKSFWDPDSDTEYGKLSNNPYSLSIDDEDDLDDDIVIVSKQNLNLPPVQYSKQFYDSNINGFETELKKFSPAYISSSSSSPLNNNNIINNNTITTITKSPIKHKNSVYNRANTEPMPISKRTFNHRLVNRQRYIHHITVNKITNNNNNNDSVISQIDVDCLKNLKYSTENKNNNNSGTIEIHAAGFRCIEEHNFQQSVNYLRRTKSLEAKNNSNELFTKTQSFSLNTNESSNNNNNNNKKISLNDYVSNRCSKSSTTTPITQTNLNNSNSESLLSNNIKKEVQTIATTAPATTNATTNEQQQLPSLSLIDEVKKRINANRNELKEELYSNQSLIKQDDLYDDDELKKIQHRHMKLKRQKKKQEKSKQKKIKLLADMSDDDDNNNNNNSLYVASSSSSFKSSDSILSDLLLSDNDDLSLTDDNDDDDSSLSSLSSLTSSTTSSSTINRHKQKKKHNKKRKISDSETNLLDTTLTITDSKKVKHSTKKKKISDNNNNSSSGSNPHNNSSNAKLIPTKDDDYSIEIGDINLDEFNAKIDEKFIDEKIVFNNNEQEILKPPSIENNYDNFYSAYDIEDSNILSDKTAKSERLSPIKSNESETIINNKKAIVQQKETPKSNQNTPINNLTPNNQSNKIMTPKTAPASLNQPNNNNNRRFQNNFANNNNNYFNNPSYVSPINPRNSQMNKSNISRNSITPPLPITPMPNNNNKSSLNYPNKMQRLNRSDYPINNNNNMIGSYPFNNVHSLDPSPSIVPNMNYVPNFYQTAMNQMSYNGNQQMSSHHTHYNNNPPVTDYPDYDFPNNNYQYYNNYNNNNLQRQGNIKEKGYNNSNNYNNFQNYNHPKNQQRNFNNNNDYRSNNNNNRHQYQLNNNQQRSSNLSSNNNNSNNHNKRAQNPDQEDGEIVD